MTNTPAACTSPVSRRGFLTSTGLATTAAVTAVPGVLGSGFWTPAAAASLPLFQPVWSETVRRSYGVAVQPQMRLTPYGKVKAWPAYVARMNAAYIRGKYGPQLPETPELIRQCRALGLKWAMTLIPENWSMSITELKAALTHIRDHAADLCIAIEGINEPNTNRSRKPVRSDWAQATVAYQRTIMEFVQANPSMSHVKVIGPSLQMASEDPRIAFDALSRAGVAQYMHYAGVHSYPGGLKPDNKVDDRLSYVRNAYGAKPSWVSETGYNNATGSPLVGPRPVPYDVSALYAPRAVFDYFSRGCNSVRYELLDEPDPRKAITENNYGLLTCPTMDPAGWGVKPEYTVMKDFLGLLKDTSRSSYTPVKVPLQVNAPSAVKWTVTGRSDGTATLHAYLNSSVWNAVIRKPVTVSPVSITVTDRVGPRTLKVGAEVSHIALR